MQKSNNIYKLLFSISLLFFTFTFNSSNSNGQETSSKSPQMKQVVKNCEGREFYLCFMVNFNEERDSDAKPLEIMLFITSEFDSKVKIEFPKERLNQTVSVNAGEIISFSLNRFAQSTLFEMEDIGQAIHITSDNPINVYGLNRRSQTTDNYLAFPVEVLGTEYMVMSYYTFNSAMQSTAAIVATEDNTEVEITPTVQTSGGKPAGTPFKVTLNKGNVYQIGARSSDLAPSVNNAKDLTGTYIKSNKKVAVFGGHQCASIPVPNIGACNVLCEQLPPVNTWGKTFYVGAFKSRSFYTYRVLASQDSTKVFEDTTLVALLQKGEFVQKNSRRNIQITTDKPVLVAQFSQGAQNGDNVGDPMMIFIPPVQQYLTRYRFATPINGYWLHYINIFVPTKSLSSVKINGQQLRENVFNRFGNTKYSIANIQLPYGSHYVECSEPFGLYSYGFGRANSPDAYDAYGAMGGQSFLDYEPVPDINPPTAEIITTNRKKTVLISDDERDDSGLSEVIVLQTNNLNLNVPAFTRGTPSVMLEPVPSDVASEGNCVFWAKDMSGNEASFTLCYIYDNTIDEFIYVVERGSEANCNVSNSWLIGAFYSPSNNFYSPEFTKTGSIEGKGEFSGPTGTGGVFGLSLTKHLFSSFNFSAKLTLLTTDASFISADSVKYFVADINSNNKVPYFNAKEINLKHIGLGLDAGLDWKFSDYIYLSGGISLVYNMNKKADIYDKILFPPGYEFAPAGGYTQTIASELSSLSAFNFGFYIGPGATCSIGYGFQLFLDVNYYYYPFSILDDSDLFMNKLNFKIGVRYQL